MTSLRPLQQPDQLTAIAARQFLDQFTCFKTTPELSNVEAEQVRQALQFLVNQSDFQTYGVCADSAEQGQQALKAYLQGLGHHVSFEVPDTETAAYIKYNLLNGKCYLEDYPGKARGVLVTCHGATDDNVNGTYGHFPLDLFTDHSAA